MAMVMDLDVRLARSARVDDYWFSRFLAEAYAQRRPGHDLLRDALLMWKGEAGRDRDRYAAINY